MSEEAAPSGSGSTIAFWGGVLVICAVLAASVAYSFHEHRIAQQLTTQNNEVTASLNAARSQMDALSAKVNELSSAKAEKPTPAQSENGPSHAYHGPVSRLVKREHKNVEDPRWKKFQGQLDEQGKQIEGTRQDLASTRTELQGSIARTHDELVVLQKKGERSYFEFDLDKDNQFQPYGPVGIRLRKANTKHEYADLELMVDDLKLSKKHVNVYEPVMFYVADGQQPVELVINSIRKDHIHGYVSQPKYKASELRAQAASPTTPGNQANTNGRQSPSASNGEPQLKQRQ